MKHSNIESLNIPELSAWQNGPPLLIKGNISPGLEKVQKLLPARKYDRYIPNPSELTLPPLLGTKTIIRAKFQHTLAKEVLCLITKKKNYTSKELQNLGSIHSSKQEIFVGLNSEGGISMENKSINLGKLSI